MVNTAQLAVKTINGDGGAAGRKLKLKVYDDKLAADESAKIANRALSVDKAAFVVGGYTSIEGLAIREVADRRNVVYLATQTVSPQLTDNDPKLTFRVSYRQDDYIPGFVALAQRLGFKRPVIAHDDAATGATLFQPLQDALTTAGASPVAPVEYSLGSTDLSSTARKMAAEKPDAVFIIGSSGADAGLLVKSMVEQGLQVPVVGTPSTASSDAQKIAGEAYRAVQVYTLSNYQPGKPEYDAFMQAYAREYDQDPKALPGTLSEAAPQTWDAFHLLADAIEAAGGKTDGSAVGAALQELDARSGAAGKEGSTVSLKDSHDAFHDSLVPFELRGAELQPVN